MLHGRIIRCGRPLPLRCPTCERRIATSALKSRNVPSARRVQRLHARQTNAREMRRSFYKPSKRGERKKTKKSNIEKQGRSIPLPNPHPTPGGRFQPPPPCLDAFERRSLRTPPAWRSLCSGMCQHTHHTAFNAIMTRWFESSFHQMSTKQMTMSIKTNGRGALVKCTLTREYGSQQPWALPPPLSSSPASVARKLKHAP